MVPDGCPVHFFYKTQKVLYLTASLKTISECHFFTDCLSGLHIPCGSHPGHNEADRQSVVVQPAVALIRDECIGVWYNTGGGEKDLCSGVRKGPAMKKKIIPTIIVIALIAVLGIFFFRNYFLGFLYSSEKTDLNSYYGVKSDSDYAVVLQDALSDYHATIIDGSLYMDYDTVRSLLNRRFYYGEADGKVWYCLPDDKVVTTVGQTGYSTTAGGTTATKYVPAVLQDGTLYLALDFVKLYTNFEYHPYTSPNRIVMYTKWGDQSVAEMTSSSNLRVTGGYRSSIVAPVSKGDSVIVLDQMQKWSKVMTEDGFIGYVENRCMGDVATKAQTPVTDYTEPTVQYKSLDKKINMAWHNISVADGNLTLDTYLNRTKDLNVIAPTWLTVSGDDGSMDLSKVSTDYVSTANSAGVQVWAVLDNFSSGTTYTSFLKTEASRTKVIDAAVDAAVQAGVTGINVDIESLQQTDGQDFVEFVRELSIACRANDLYISVDNYVPYNFNDYYDLGEQAAFVDYVVIMGYDEHYAGDDEAGSVASIDYVTYGITEALKWVPKERLINGVPFFTRIWITNSDGLTSQAVGMEDCRTFIKNHNITMQWDDSVGQQYGETTENGTTYQVWQEGPRSIGLKLSVMQENGLAGVAEWCLGFDDDQIWDTIANYMEE